jgi:hypothetical protein
MENEEKQEERKPTTEEMLEMDRQRQSALKQRKAYHEKLKFELETMRLEEEHLRLSKSILENKMYFDRLNAQMKAQQEQEQKKENVDAASKEVPEMKIRSHADPIEELDKEKGE